MERGAGGVVILHCSDLHFGRLFQHDLAKALLRKIEAISPAAVVVSGDLTMRARRTQFIEAREFLAHIACPLVIIPGNHDVPLFNIFQRMTRPFANYERFISGMSRSPLHLEGVAVYGINSVNPRRHQQGLFTWPTVREVRRWLDSMPPATWKIIVTHQHFVAIPGLFRPGSIRDAERVLTELADAGAHAVLCGHMHFKYIGSTRDFFPHLPRPLALIHAGTATSGRLRGPEMKSRRLHVNNIVLLRFSPGHFEVTPLDWDDIHEDFVGGETIVFDRAFFGETVRPENAVAPRQDSAQSGPQS